MNEYLETPEAVVFDLGDTIFHTEEYDRTAGIRALLEHVVDDRGMSVEKIARRSEEIDNRLEKSCAAEHIEYRQRDFHRLLYGSFGLSFTIPEEEAERLYWKSSLTLALEPGVEEALATLEARNIRRAVISNAVYGSTVLRGELDRLGVAKYFEFVMSSADYGVRKPDPLLFEVARVRLGLKKSKCWYVGNLVEADMGGAKRAGWQPVWYAADAVRRGTYEKRLGELPEGTPVVADWDDFPR